MFNRQVRCVVVALLCFSIASTGFSAPTGTASVTYDADTLLRGIFLGRGPVAEKLPEIWSNQQISRFKNSLHSANAAIAEERILQRIHADDRAGVPLVFKKGFLGAAPAESARPGTFAARFAANVQSGNPVRIHNALREASIRLVHAALVEAGKDPANVNVSELMTDSEIDPNSAVVIAAVVAIGAVVVWVIAAVAVDVWYISHPDVATTIATPDDLRAEMGINLIATRLRSAN